MYMAEAPHGNTLFADEDAYFTCNLPERNNNESPEVLTYQFQVDSQFSDDTISTVKTKKIKTGAKAKNVEVRCRAKNSLGVGMWSSRKVFQLQNVFFLCTYQSCFEGIRICRFRKGNG